MGSPAAVPYVHQEIPAMPYVHDSQGDVDVAGAYSNVAGVKSGLCANFQGAQVPCAHANKYNGMSAASAYASAAAVPYVHQEIPAVPYVHDPQGDVDMAGAYSSVPTYNTVARMSPAAVPYVHQEIPAMPYVHDSQGDVDMAGAYSKVAGVNSGLCANSQGAQVPCAHSNKYNGVSAASAYASAAAVPYVHQEIPAVPYVHDPQGDVDMAGAYSNAVGINSGLCVNVQGVQVPCAN